MSSLDARPQFFFPASFPAIGRIRTAEIPVCRCFSVFNPPESEYLFRHNDRKSMV